MQEARVALHVPSSGVMLRGRHVTGSDYLEECRCLIELLM